DVAYGARPAREAGCANRAERRVGTARRAVAALERHAGAEHVVVVDRVHDGQPEATADLPNRRGDPGKVMRVDDVRTGGADNPPQPRARIADEVADVIPDPAATVVAPVGRVQDDSPTVQAVVL